MVKKRLAIFRYHFSVYSETFIDDHVAYIAKDPVVLAGAPCPIYLNQTDTILSAEEREAVQRLPSAEAEALQWQALHAYLRRENVGVLMAEFGPTGVLVLETSRKLGIPLLVHFHGYDASIPEVLEQCRPLWDSDATFVAVSEKMKRRLVSEGAREERIHVVPCGVVPPETGLAAPDKNRPLLLAVGRFVPKKSPQSTLRAFAKASQAVPESRLIMGGDGPLLDECRVLAQELGVAARVEFPGVLSREEVRRLMGAARAFVQHSVTAPNGDEEGLPVAVMEAGSYGLPVVSTFHAGIPEAVVDGETGLLVAEHDIDGMAVAMETVLRDGKRAAEMGAAARKRIGLFFTRERCIGKLQAALGLQSF